MSGMGDLGGNGAREILVANLPWMSWNATLALLPLLLAPVLFGAERRNLAWWTGAAAFLALLPNAPYVLTDVVHVTGDVRTARSDLGVAFGILPQYALFFAFGFACYVGSLRLLSGYLARLGWPPAALGALRIAVHAMCAVGIWLGRFGRWNSWDLLAQPFGIARDLHVGLDQRFSVAMMAAAFVVLLVGTAVTNVVLDAVPGYRRMRRAW